MMVFGVLHHGSVCRRVILAGSSCHRRGKVCLGTKERNPGHQRGGSLETKSTVHKTEGVSSVLYTTNAYS